MPCSINLTAEVINKPNGNDILSQYMQFCSRVYKMFRIHGRNADAVMEAIKYCKDHNILRDYLTGREAEVTSQMMRYFSQEEAVDMALRAERREGKDEGRAEGHAEGRAEGEHDILLLLDLLERDNREEEARAMRKDKSLRAKLFAEYADQLRH